VVNGKIDPCSSDQNYKLSTSRATTSPTTSIISTTNRNKFKNLIISTKPSISPHIIGGIPVQKAEFPFAAAVIYDGEFICGGSLIAPSFVLTAKHCNPVEYVKERYTVSTVISQ
jgi:secreted trypsin-like serine protease